jgi:hypothetical protein
VNDFISDLANIERLFQLMGTYGIAIAELGEGVKFVKQPDSAPTLNVDSHEVKPQPRSISEDPMLYSDGVVPGFSS